ncbi:MAG: TolB family protein [Thermomicrobiales bacterium]
MKQTPPFRPLRHLAAAFLLFTLLAGGTPAPVGAATSDPFNIKPVMSAAPTADQADPVMAGTVISWADRRTGIFDVVTYDTDQGQEQRLALAVPLPTPGTERSQPALDGQTLVWVNTPPPGATQGNTPDATAPLTQTIGAYDLTRHKVIPLPNIGAGPKRRPSVGGSLIVYGDKRNGDWDIYGYDMTTSTEFPIAVGGGAHGYTAISGSFVLYEVYRDGSWDIMGYNVKDKTTFPVAAGPGDQNDPQIAGNTVVYIDQGLAGGNPMLKLYDIETKQTKTVTKDHRVVRPAISGALIVWEDWRNGAPNIFAFDTKKNSEYTLTRSGDARTPFVSGQFIGWLKSDAFSARVTAVQLVPRLPSDRLEAPTVPEPDALYFKETGHYIKYGFKEFWQSHGSLAYFGYPITEEFPDVAPDGQQVTVQYFERSKLEFVKATGVTRIGLVGTELTRDRGFNPIAPFPDTADRRYFKETGHSLASGFKKYWDDTNGLNTFGFPISEEITENGLDVQYFERGRLEYHPELAEGKRITLGRLGEELLEARGWIKPPPADTTRFPER